MDQFRYVILYKIRSPMNELKFCTVIVEMLCANV